jgi:hypothetical protein
VNMVHLSSLGAFVCPQVPARDGQATWFAPSTPCSSVFVPLHLPHARREVHETVASHREGRKWIRRSCGMLTPSRKGLVPGPID